MVVDAALFAPSFFQVNTKGAEKPCWNLYFLGLNVQPDDEAMDLLTVEQWKTFYASPQQKRAGFTIVELLGGPAVRDLRRQP